MKIIFCYILNPILIKSVITFLIKNSWNSCKSNIYSLYIRQSNGILRVIIAFLNNFLILYRLGSPTQGERDEYRARICASTIFFFFLSQRSKRTRTRVHLVRAIISRASSHARVIKNKKTKEVSGNNNANGHRCEGAQSQSGS